MPRKIVIALTVLAILATLAWAGCFGKEDDDESSIDYGEPPGGIAILLDILTDNRNRTASELRKIFSLRGGSMEGSVAYAYLSYEDPDCNLGKGEFFVSIDGAAAESYGSIAGGAPCAADANDKEVGFAFSATGVGSHTIEVQVTDMCGAKSGSVSMNFTLTKYVAGEDDDDDTIADDDTADDDTVAPMLLIGDIETTGEEDLAGRTVTILLYTQWLPSELVPVAFHQETVPAERFPFAYEWDLDAAAVEPGYYYVAAFADAADGDGYFNTAVDPFHSPYLPQEFVEGETMTANLMLVAPSKR